MVPTAVFVELHTPPGVTSLNVVEEPAHTVPEPDNVPAFGAAFTVAVVVAKQPAPVCA